MMMDVLFLDRHPGWSWQDLQDAPDELIQGMRLLDRKRAEYDRTNR